MDSWFTVEPIDGETWAISEYRHWEETHCYLLRGSERAVLIDTGLGVGNLERVVRNLTELPVLVLTTHAHWDHIGGHRQFAQYAVHGAERDWVTGGFPLPLSAVKQQLLRQPCDFPSAFRPDEYRIFQGEPQLLLQDGMELPLGNRSLTVLHTPGHSPGHCCFHEAERGWLFTGDLLYAGCLDAFYPSTDPLRFYRSVQRVRRLKPERLFPGHHRLDPEPELIGTVEAAFQELSEAGLLRHGSGLFDYGTFQIHL